MAYQKTTMTKEKSIVAKIPTKIQPKDGDEMIHCGHLNAENHHFWKVPNGVLRFHRPDGTFGEAEWVVASTGAIRGPKRTTSVAKR